MHQRIYCVVARLALPLAITGAGWPLTACASQPQSCMLISVLSIRPAYQSLISRSCAIGHMVLGASLHSVPDGRATARMPPVYIVPALLVPVTQMAGHRGHHCSAATVLCTFTAGLCTVQVSPGPASITVLTPFLLIRCCWSVSYCVPCCARVSRIFNAGPAHCVRVFTSVKNQLT